MDENHAAMADLLFRRLKTLQEDPSIGQTEEWTVKRTAEEIRQKIGPVLFQHVDELTPGLAPSKDGQQSLNDYRRVIEVLLTRHTRQLTRDTVSPDPAHTVISASSSNVTAEPEYPSDAATLEMPVRRRNWREFWWDIQGKWKRFWRSGS